MKISQNKCVRNIYHLSPSGILNKYKTLNESKRTFLHLKDDHSNNGMNSSADQCLYLLVKMEIMIPKKYVICAFDNIPCSCSMHSSLSACSCSWLLFLENTSRKRSKIGDATLGLLLRQTLSNSRTVVPTCS